MSVRPQPVTGTFRSMEYYSCLRPGLRPSPQYVTLQEYSDSCSGSTESLTSILHHDSYESDNSTDYQSDKADGEMEEIMRAGEQRRHPVAMVTSQTSGVKRDTRISSYHRSQPSAVTKETVSTTALTHQQQHKPRNTQRRIVSRKPRQGLTSQGSPSQLNRTASSTARVVTVVSDERGKRPSQTNRSGSVSESSSRPIHPKTKSQMRSKSISESASELSQQHSSNTGNCSASRSLSADSAMTSSKQGEIETIDHHLTAWEEWLLAKEKRKRLQQKRAAIAQKREREKSAQQDREKVNKAKHVEEKVSEWLEKKKQTIKEHNRKMKIKERIDEEEKEAEKTTQQERSAPKYAYSVWQKQKSSQLARARSEDRERRDRKATQQAQQHRQAEAAFYDWKRAAAGRPVTAPYSYGYADGKLTGYYDKTTNPPPSFINPRPWVPPEVKKPFRIRTRPSLGSRQQTCH